MSKLLIVALLVLVIGMIGAALSFAHFGWIGLFGYFLLTVVGLYAVFRLGYRIVVWCVTYPLRREGRVLKDAHVTVRSIERSQAPDRGPTLDDIRQDADLLAQYREDYETHVGDLEAHENPPTFDEWLADTKQDEAREDQRLNWYDMDVTIAPAAEQSQEDWTPGFLILSGVIDRTRTDRLDDHEFVDCGQIETIEQWDEAANGFLPLSRDDHCNGSTRLRLRLGLRRRVQRFWLTYYLIPMPGEITVPEARDTILG